MIGYVPVGHMRSLSGWFATNRLKGSDMWFDWFYAKSIIQRPVAQWLSGANLLFLWMGFL